MTYLLHGLTEIITRASQPNMEFENTRQVYGSGLFAPAVTTLIAFVIGLKRVDSTNSKTLLLQKKKKKNAI